MSSASPTLSTARLERRTVRRFQRGRCAVTLRRGSSEALPGGDAPDAVRGHDAASERSGKAELRRLTDGQDATVAVFDCYDAADAAMRALKDHGLDAAQIAVIGHGVHNEGASVGASNTGKQIKHWIAYGALLGALGGWLLIGLLWIPSTGQITALRWIVANLASGACGAATGSGIGATAAVLFGGCVADRAIPLYQSALQAHRYLVVVRGSSDNLETAKAVLATTEATHIGLHVTTND